MKLSLTVLFNPETDSTSESIKKLDRALESAGFDVIEVWDTNKGTLYRTE